MAGERHQKAKDLLRRVADNPGLQRKWREDPVALIREHGLGEHESHTEENAIAGAARHGMAKEEAVRLHRASFEALRAHLRSISAKALDDAKEGGN